VGPLGPATALDFQTVDETLSRGAALFPFVLGGQMATPEAIAEALRTSSPTRLRDNLFVANSILLDRFETLSYAAFGELSYAFTERLSLTAGARFTHERRFRQGKQLQLASPQNFNADISGLPIDDRFDKWTSRLQLSYQATDQVFLYGSYSRGFKSGGFNADVIAPNAFGLATQDRGKFDEEVVDAYELGVKTQWLDRRLVLNLSGFYYQYDDIQITTPQINEQGTPESRISNVAEAVIRGLELEIQALPVANLTLAAGLGLIDDDYRDFTARVDGRDVLLGRPDLRPPAGCQGLALEDACPLLSQLRAVGFLINPGELPFADMSDLDRSNTPNFSMNLSADYRFDLGDLGALDLRATWYHQGQVFYTTNNDDEVAQDKYGLLNGRISWELWDGKTTLGLFGRNLLDRRYLEGGVSLNDGIGTKRVYYGRPRSYGIEISRRF
jgi:iron complex outermembrane receptor protein